MSDVTSRNAHGPVHTLRTEFAEWDLAVEQWQAARYFTLERFHPSGTIAEDQSHNPDGSFSRSSYVYDSVGRLEEIRFEMNGSPTGTRIHFYDEDGRLTRVAGVGRDGTERQTEAYSYGQDSTRTKVYSVPKMEPNTGFVYTIEGSELSYDATDATTITTRYEEHGQPDEVSFFDEEHRLLKRLMFTRDDTGRLLKEEMRLVEPLAAVANVFGRADIMPSTTYAYDEEGRLVERRTRLGELGDDRTTFRYDDRGNPMEQTIDDNSREMEIDEQGNLHPTKETSHKQNVRFDYQYDAHGNWTERVVWSRLEPNPNFQRSNVVRREITYYAG